MSEISFVQSSVLHFMGKPPFLQRTQINFVIDFTFSSKEWLVVILKEWMEKLLQCLICYRNLKA